MKTFFHGEVIVVEAKQIPEGCKRVISKNNSYLLADSEQTGNYHLLEEKEGVELFEDKNGVLWLKNEVPCDVFCAIKERHDTITLEPGIWEIDRAQEYDYLTEMTRKVAD